MAIQETARIYNLFPRLVGSIPNWTKHFTKVAKMKFNWLFLNPFQQTGFSGSLYSIKDYYKLNPMFYDPSVGKSETEQLKWMIDQAHKQGLKVMMDLVINHTAIDHPFTTSHKEWYMLKAGKIVRPGAWDDGKWVSWGDLAEINNESSSDRDNLWRYWLDMVLYYLDLGFDGFRCDAAYKLPVKLWQYLIGKSKERFPDVVWFAESLGCPIEQTITLGQSGFEYTFNSSKWWDYKEEWCLKQYNENAPYSKTVSFPESHDTPRLYEAAQQNPKVIEHNYLFSALFSSGVMIPIGFEYGFRKRLNVVSTTQEDYEDIQHDFSDYITQVNSLKSSYQIFNEESKLEQIPVKENKEIIILMKTSLDNKEKSYFIINTDHSKAQTIFLKSCFSFLSRKEKIQDISLSNRLQDLTQENQITVQPSEIKIFFVNSQK